MTSPAISPLWGEPLHRAYQGDEVYVMPPPSSGGVMLEMLGMLETGASGRPRGQLASKTPNEVQAK